jgi:hypothetical protein
VSLSAILCSSQAFENIKNPSNPLGDGKGGTYFGTTGCGKVLPFESFVNEKYLLLAQQL